MLKPRGFFEHRGTSSGGVVSGNLRATRTLLALAVVAGGLVLVIIGWPLVTTGRPDVPPRVFWAAFAYFAIIGLAFMLIQIAFLQRFSVYLGHPTYTFSIILFLMILSAGLGSFASERIDLDRHRSILWLPIAIAVAVLLETVLLQRVVDATVGWGLPGRSLIVSFFVAPLAFALGCCFPIGLRFVGRHSDRLSAWMWGVNGACGVMSRCCTRRRMGLRQRRLAASRPPTGSWRNPTARTGAVELQHDAAGGRLVLRQWWLGAAELAVRTDGRVRWRRPRPWLGVHRSGWLGATKSSARGWRRRRLTAGFTATEDTYHSVYG